MDKNNNFRDHFGDNLGDNSQNADGRSHNFQRQRSFATKDNNQRRLSPLTSGNSPPRTQGYVLLKISYVFLMDNMAGIIFIFFFRRANVDSGWTEVHSRYVSFLEMRSNEGSFVIKKYGFS